MQEARSGLSAHVWTRPKSLQQKGQFVEEEASFYTQGKLRLAQELPSFWLWSLSLTSLPLHCIHAMYDLSYES